MNPLAIYLLAAELAWAPPQDHAYRGEKPWEVVQRYESIAEDIAEVALEEKPIVGSVEQTALLLDAWFSYESGEYRSDVDTILPTGDGGRSRCIAQIQLRPGEIMRDRKDCIRLAYARMRESFAVCSFLPIREKGAVYASGSCLRGREASVKRTARALDWWKSHPFK